MNPLSFLNEPLMMALGWALIQLSGRGSRRIWRSRQLDHA